MTRFSKSSSTDAMRLRMCRHASTTIQEGIAQMPKVRVAGFGVSLDGFSAGIEQSRHDPIGKRGLEIFQWFFHTKTFCSMHGRGGGTIGDVDDQFAQRARENFGAYILGRNMFGPL